MELCLSAKIVAFYSGADNGSALAVHLCTFGALFLHFYFTINTSVLDTEEYLSGKFCNAKIVSIKFIEENTIQIWLDNSDEYSLCD